MYDESWMNSFIDRTEPANLTSPPTRSKPISSANHVRVDSVEPPLKSLRPVRNPPPSPPKAHVPRRAESFSGSSVVNPVLAPPFPKHVDDFDIGTKSKKIGVGTEAEYVDWYNTVKDDLLEASHIEYKVYLEQLRLAESHLDQILLNANSALDQLRSLSESFKHVDLETSAFQEQCEAIVHDQGRTGKLADDIAENLQYYAYLEPITKRLNAPGASNLVRRAEFSEILSNLDACIEYMQSHLKQKDATTYRGRYKQLLTRGLTLIRNQFTAALRDLATETAKKMANEQLNETTSNALLYGKFKMNAPEFKRMGFEIQKRAVAPEGGKTSEAEYLGLLNELYQNYAATRVKLLYAFVAKKIANIAATPSSSTDLVAFARSCIIYVRGLCADEYELWSAWFVGEGALYDFLETLCEPMYDLLRPRTIRETQLMKLCELCTFIQTQYLATPDDLSDDNEISSPTDTRPKLDFPRLIQPALEDAQTRLVFLALTVLRNDIELYKASPEDLDYPAKNQRVASKQPVLSGKRNVNGHESLGQNGNSENGPLSAINGGGTSSDWYPTLRKAIWLLGRIYRLVNSAVFDDLAHQIVHETTISLQSAATQISKRVSPTDSQLFLLKYLLILKQQIIAYDIEFSPTPEIDFSSSLTHTFHELRDRGSLFNPLSWGRIVAGSGYALLVPRVVTNMLDAKSELDGGLRTTITDFTTGFVDRITEPVSEAVIKAAGTSFDPLAATVKIRGNVEEQAPFLRKKLDEYLDDMRTRETLVAAVQDQVCLVYEEFCEGHVEGGKGRGRTGVGRGKGKGREDGVWDPSVFSDWSRDVFGVVQIGFDDGDEDDRGSMRGNESE